MIPKAHASTATWVRLNIVHYSPIRGELTYPLLKTADCYRNLLRLSIAPFNNQAALQGFPSRLRQKEVKSDLLIFAGKQIEIVVTVHDKIRNITLGRAPFSAQAHQPGELLSIDDV